MFSPSLGPDANHSLIAALVHLTSCSQQIDMGSTGHSVLNSHLGGECHFVNGQAFDQPIPQFLNADSIFNSVTEL